MICTGSGTVKIETDKQDDRNECAYESAWISNCVRPQLAACMAFSMRKSLQLAYEWVGVWCGRDSNV